MKGDVKSVYMTHGAFFHRKNDTSAETEGAYPVLVVSYAGPSTSLRGITKVPRLSKVLKHAEDVK